MTLTKPPLDSPHTVNLLPTLRFSPEWKALYWIAVTALLTARVMFFGFTFFDEKFELQSPWFIPVIVLHSLYIIALPIAAYAKSARMIQFALYAFAGSMIMPFLFSVEHLVAFAGGGWPNLPPIMLILSAPLVLLYNNSDIIHKHRQAFQKTFRVVVIITLVSTVVYFFPIAILFRGFSLTNSLDSETSNTVSVLYNSAINGVLYNFLFGGFGHVPLLAMVIVWRYLDTNRFNSILRTLTTAATIAVLGCLFALGVSVTFGGTDLLSGVATFLLLTLPGFISIFFMARVALRSVTTVHPFISPFGYPIFKVLGPKPMAPIERDFSKPTSGTNLLAAYRDDSLFRLSKDEEAHIKRDRTFREASKNRTRR